MRRFPAAPDHSDPAPKEQPPVEEALHAGRGLIRFLFGNPLIAVTLLREDVEAGLHVPVECCFVELEDGGTKMVMMMPGGLVAGHQGASENQRLKEAVAVLEEKVMKLVGEVMR